MGNVVQTLIMVIMLIAFGQTGKTDTLDKKTLAVIWRAQVNLPQNLMGTATAIHSVLGAVGLCGSAIGCST